MYAKISPKITKSWGLSPFVLPIVSRYKTDSVGEQPLKLSKILILLLPIFNIISKEIKLN